jgi:hypothetical protein
VRSLDREALLAALAVTVDLVLRESTDVGEVVAQIKPLLRDLLRSD